MDFVGVLRYGFAGARVYERLVALARLAAAVVEARRFVDAEDGRVSWRVDEGFGRAALDVVLDSVEEELSAQEVEEVAGGLFRDVGLVVE